MTKRCLFARNAYLMMTPQMSKPCEQCISLVEPKVMQLLCTLLKQSLPCACASKRVLFFRKRGIQARPEPTALAHVAEWALPAHVPVCKLVCRVEHVCVNIMYTFRTCTWYKLPSPHRVTQLLRICDGLQNACITLSLKRNWV